MYYLDSNIFILPILYEGRKSSIALSVLKQLVKGHINGATSSLTFDEITWTITKRYSREAALMNIELILKFPHLKILEVRKQDISKMLEIMRENKNTAPRDAVHASVSLRHNINRIISDDMDFSRMPGINHISLESFEKSNV